MKRNGNHDALLVGVYNDAAAMKNSMMFPQKVLNRIIILSNSSTSEHISKELKAECQ